MLVGFSLKNFKSVADTQTLSMVASTLKNREQNLISVGYQSLNLVRSAVIYGANASGKSSLIEGLMLMRHIVLNSATDFKSTQNIPINPFKLDKTFQDIPTEMEIIFILENKKYQYGFSFFKDRFVEEWLFVTELDKTKSRAQKWLTRRWDEDKQEYENYINPAIKGEKEVWKKSTRSNSLLLSMSLQLNNQDFKVVEYFFKNKLKLSSDDGWDNTFTLKNCLENTAFQQEVIQFLKAADMGIDSINIQKKLLDLQMLPDDMPPAIKELFRHIKDKDVYKVQTGHKTKSNEMIFFDLHDESKGTQKLFEFSGPWIDTLRNGNVLIIDELNKNLHPNLVKYLVELFNNPKTNLRNAQLVFTTHETAILNQEIFRRDQIWFCEKTKIGATRLYPLTDFSIRKREKNLEQDYLTGRFGGLPFISDFVLGE